MKTPTATPTTSSGVKTSVSGFPTSSPKKTRMGVAKRAIWVAEPMP